MPARGLLRPILAAVAFNSAPGAAADSAVVFMYHHVGTGTPAATSTTPERFRRQLEYLDEEGFAVLPLMEVVAALREGRPLPERSVVLTFDDGYTSIRERAAPLLEERRWPYTIFVSPGQIDRGYGAYLGWEDLRQLAAAGATIGNHSLYHSHLVRREPGESPDAHLARVRADIRQADRRLADELPVAAIVRAFAYPYGEYDAGLAAVVGELGLIGLGQHSGAIGAGSDWLALPRFPVATGFDALDDFSLRARTLPLDLQLDDPRTTLNAAGDGRPAFSARVPDELDRRRELACYAGGQGRLELDWHGDPAAEIVTVKPQMALAPGRTKINCTIPHGSQAGVYYWFSKLWLTRHPDGSWYSE